MIKPKEDLSKFITEQCKKHITNVAGNKSIINNLSNKYDIPANISSDILTLRVDTIQETEFILFCILEEIDSHSLPKFFTEIEIKEYRKQKFVIPKVSMPIRWKMIQVTEDQWIGTITVKELMKLRNSQIIRYNENAQRTLKRLMAGNVEYYKIDVNYDAVRAIVDSFDSETYIPNTITLNLPETAEFVYKDGELIIKECDFFDILDGYHRFVAMSMLSNLKNDFDQIMELRVTCFSDEKARQFIWQEDQKTKMSKIDSDALNQLNPGNQVVQLLNSKGILTNCILRNGGIIDAAVMGQLVNVLFFSEYRNKKIERKKLIEVRDYIYHRMTCALDAKPNMLDKSWDYIYTACVMLLIAKNDISDTDLIEQISDLYQKALCEKHLFSSRTFNQTIVTRLDKLYKR